MKIPDTRTGVFFTFPSGKTKEIRIPVLDDDLLEVYRAWTPAQKFAASDDQMRFVRSLLHGVIASENPDWSEDEVRKEIARRILGDGL